MHNIEQFESGNQKKSIPTERHERIKVKETGKAKKESMQCMNKKRHLRPHQHTTQHFHPPPCASSSRAALSRDRYPPDVPDGAPSRINMLALVAASNTSSTPSILSAEHSLYARAPISTATRSACARETYCPMFGAFGGGRRSALQPTSRIGIVGPHIFLTSSIHCERRRVRRDQASPTRHTLTDTFSSESGVSIANAIKMTCDLEYESGRRR